MDQFYKHIKHIFSFLIYRVLLIGRPHGKANCSDEKTAIVALGALGDFIVSCSAIQVLFLQGKRLTLVCRENLGIEEFAQLTGYFEAVLTLPHSFSSRLSNLRRLRKICVHTVLILPPERHILSDLYALSICANERIFPDTTQGCSLPSLKRLVDRRIDELIPVNARNELRRQEQLLSGCGLCHRTLSPFIFPTNPQEKRRRERIILVFPGTGVGCAKQWPLDRFVAVVDTLCREESCRAVICGTEKDQAACGELFDQLSIPVENLSGQTSLPVLGDWLKRCALVLANDSGSAHLAVAYGAPAVIIGGGWEYGRFYPTAYLPGNCRAVLALPESLPCIPCGKSQPECTKGVTAPCLMAVETKAVLEAARCCIEFE